MKTTSSTGSLPPGEKTLIRITYFPRSIYSNYSTFFNVIFSTVPQFSIIAFHTCYAADITFCCQASTTRGIFPTLIFLLQSYPSTQDSTLFKILANLNVFLGWFWGGSWCIGFVFCIFFVSSLYLPNVKANVLHPF